MRAVLQRVRYGAVRVDGQIAGAIDQGFVILVGVGHQDGDEQALWLARKIAGLRVFEDADGKFNLSLLTWAAGAWSYRSSRYMLTRVRAAVRALPMPPRPPSRSR